MKPQIPPVIIRVICSARLTMARQAEAAGIRRNWLHHLTRSDWSRWKVETAERWCRACGFDFWDLQLKPEDVSTVNWASGEERVIQAMETVYRLRYPEVRPTRKIIQEIGAKLVEHYGCQPPAKSSRNRTT